MDISTQVILYLGLPLILWFLYKYITTPNNYWEKHGAVNVKESSWIEYMIESFGNKYHEKDVERLKKYGKIYGFYEFGYKPLMVSDPQLIRNVMVKDFNVFNNPRDFAVSGDPLEHMMFTLRGERWKRVRTIISPVFTTGKIKKVFPHVTNAVKTLMKNLSTASKKGEDTDIRKLYEAFAMDLIASAAFATKIDSHNDPQNPFVVNAKRVFSQAFPWRFILFGFLPSLMKLFHISLTDPTSGKFFTDVCTRIVAERKRMTGEKPNDFMQLMMDSSAEAAGDDGKDMKNKKLTTEELMANSVMFFLVAFGTTSITLSFASYLLALYPECQEKLIQEIDETLEKNNHELSYETVQDMKYLDMVLSEVLRMYPAAIRTERVAEIDYKLGDTGIIVPKGTLVTIPIFALHHDPDYYPDPDKFDPNRFTAEEKAKRDPYAYMPFSLGPRNCVGMRFAQFDIKACLAYTLSQFRFKKCPGTQIPLNFYANVQGLIEPDKVLLRVEERTDKVLKNFY